MVSVSYSPMHHVNHQGVNGINRCILVALLFIAILNLYESRSPAMNKLIETLITTENRIEEQTVAPCPLQEKEVVTEKVIVTVPAPAPVSADFADSKWCPKAACNNSAQCTPCSRRFLIIIASGRSASTTLTWMLNTLPGVRMSGENNDLLKQLHQVHESTFRHPQFIGSDYATAWGHREIAPQATACVAQAWVEGMNPPLVEEEKNDDSDTIIGFKTIRFVNGVNSDDMESLVSYVTEHFPCARFIINHRSDVKAQADSLAKAWAGDAAKKNKQEWVENTNSKLQQVANLLGKDRAIFLDSTKWTKDVTLLNEAIEWLGFENCVFKELMEFNIDRYKNGQTEASLPKGCQYRG